jgi:hypothetical protein
MAYFSIRYWFLRGRSWSYGFEADCAVLECSYRGFALSCKPVIATPTIKTPDWFQCKETQKTIEWLRFSDFEFY